MNACLAATPYPEEVQFEVIEGDQFLSGLVLQGEGPKKKWEKFDHKFEVGY